MVLLLFSVVSNSNNVIADQLPSGASVSTGTYPSLDFVKVEVFSNPGPQTVSFPSPANPVKTLFSTVTSYVSNAKLYFTADGVEYSYSISPNSNTQLTFQNPLVISNVKMAIDGRGYSDDAGHVGYIYGSNPLPPPDSDSDGIVDTSDSCPTQAENYNNYQDSDGCPDTTPSKLPSGTSVSTGNAYPSSYMTTYSVVVSNPGSQTHSFPNPAGQVSKIFTTVTTYVQGAVLFFDSGGTTYSVSITPNSNAIYTFAGPLSISNVRIGIDGRGYPDDAIHFAYQSTVVNQDSDGDGIVDTSDSCLNQAEDKDGYQDSDGCPEENPPSIQTSSITVNVNPSSINENTPASVKVSGRIIDSSGIGISGKSIELSLYGNSIMVISDSNGYFSYAFNVKMPYGSWNVEARFSGDNSHKSSVGNTSLNVQKIELPIIDRDKDRIPDSSDKCPDHQETYNGVDDNDGCPDQVKLPFEFKILGNPSSGIIEAGQSFSSTLNLQVSSGNPQPVSLSCSGIPSSQGKCLLNDSPRSIIVTLPAYVTLKIETGKTTTIKTYSVTITGTSGETNRSITFPFTVTQPTISSGQETNLIDNYSIDTSRHQAYSKIKGEIVKISVVDIKSVNNKEITATLKITNTRNAKYAIDISPGCSSKYSQTVFLNEKESKTFSQKIPKFLVENKDMYCVRVDVNIAANVYLVSYILENIIGFSPHQDTISEISQAIKNEYFPNESYLSAIASNNSLNKWINYFVDYMRNHPDKFVKWTGETGVNFTIEKISDKISIVINLSMTAVRSVSALVLSLSVPAEETLWVNMAPKMQNFAAMDKSGTSISSSTRDSSKAGDISTSTSQPSTSNVAKIPANVKNDITSWVKGKTNDSKFVSALKEMINQGLLQGPKIKYTKTTIPSHAKTLSQSWIDDKLSDAQYLAQLQSMISKNKIKF